MTEIIGQPEWSPVRLLGVEPAMGGEDGNMNEQAKALANRTELLMQEKASKDEIIQGQYSFETLAKFDAKKATLPVDCIVNIDEVGPNQGTNTWDGITLKKSPYDPLNLAKIYTKDSILVSEKNSIEFSKVSKDGGQFYYSKASSYSFLGYINPTGSFVSSTAGYKTTDFIPIYPGKKFKYSLNASSSVAAISYWDENKAFISAFGSNNNPAEVEVTPPANAKFIRSSSNLNVTPNAYVYTVFESILNDPSLIKTGSLNIKESDNLAKSSLKVNDYYVNNAGTISAGVGWKYIKIPVLAGTSYTFGRFTIDSAGYYAFQDASGNLIAASNGSYQNSTLPKVVTAPVGAAFLVFDFARPTNTTEQHAELTVNVGTTLIDYVDPVGTVIGIAGYKVEGGSPNGEVIPSNVVVQGGNATLTDIIADSLTTGALIANLPTSDLGLEVGQAWIDNGFVKVKL